MDKIFVVIENYRNEKCGDSTETTQVVGAYKKHDRAMKEVAELIEEKKEEAVKLFDEENLVIETGEYGSQIYLEYEWDTYHCDYTIQEVTVE